MIQEKLDDSCSFILQKNNSIEDFMTVDSFSRKLYAWVVSIFT